MKRLFYLAAGAGIGVAAVRKLSRAADKFTPTGIAGSMTESVSGVTRSVRGFVDDVRLSMAERELELRDALTAEARGHPASDTANDTANDTTDRER